MKKGSGIGDSEGFLRYIVKIREEYSKEAYFL